eukprot:1583293-Prymnesium_polylepis.1
MTAAALPERPRRGRAASQGPPPLLKRVCEQTFLERKGRRRSFRPSASRDALSVACAVCVIAFDGASDGVQL